MRGLTKRWWLQWTHLSSEVMETWADRNIWPMEIHVQVMLCETEPWVHLRLRSRLFGWTMEFCWDELAKENPLLPSPCPVAPCSEKRLTNWQLLVILLLLACTHTGIYALPRACGSIQTLIFVSCWFKIHINVCYHIYILYIHTMYE